MRMFNSCKFLLLVFVFASCGKNEFYNQDKTIEGAEWDYRKKVDFEVDITDTVSFYDIYVDFRHNDNYAYADIYMFLNIEFPNKRMLNDTLHIPMQDYTGKWYGKNSGSLTENHVLVKPKTGFPMTGKYKISIAHAMRDDKLAGIEDVGLTISKKD
jgi:gliding motility-associated lipoprotein GldH